MDAVGDERPSAGQWQVPLSRRQYARSLGPATPGTLTEA